MNKIYILFSILIFTFAFSQNREFKNQGEQEIFWAQQIFEKEYQIQKHSKYKGKIIVINKNKILFRNKTLNLNIFEFYLPIFTNGLFYPQLILGDSENNKILTENELEKLTTEERVFNQLGRNDVFNISNLEELTLQNKNPKIKRFKFWSFMPGMANAKIYYFELTNDKADEKTTLNNFVKKAKLTYLKAGGIII